MTFNNKGLNNRIKLPDHIKLNSDITIVGFDNIIEIAESVIVKELSLNITGNGHLIRIDNNVILKKLSIFIIDNYNTCSIGENTTIEDCSISIADRNNSVILGKDAMLASNISIMASDFHSILDEHKKRINMSSGIEVGDHVWIGNNCTILKNTKIGNNTILASHSLVNKSIPGSVIAGGIPAKIIKKNYGWDRQRFHKPFLSKKEIINFTNFDMETNIKFNIESIIRNEEEVPIMIITGWAIIPNCRSSETKIMLCVQYEKETNYYKSDLIIRDDVVSALKNEDYLLSGFMFGIINEKIIKIELVIQNHDLFVKKNINNFIF